MIYGNPEVTSGGQALKYYASVRWVHRTARWQLILQGCTSALGHSAPPTHLAQLCQDERCQSHRQRLLQPLQPGHTGQPAAQPHKHNLGCPCPPPPWLYRLEVRIKEKISAGTQGQIGIRVK